MQAPAETRSEAGASPGPPMLAPVEWELRSVHTKWPRLETNDRFLGQINFAPEGCPVERLERF